MEKLIALSINGINIYGAGGVPTGGEGATLNKILSTGVTLAMIAAVIICIVFIIIGGFTWIMSEGDKQKLDQAHKRVAFALIGLVVVFLAFWIINIIYSIFLS